MDKFLALALGIAIYFPLLFIAISFAGCWGQFDVSITIAGIFN